MVYERIKKLGVIQFVLKHFFPILLIVLIFCSLISWNLKTPLFFWDEWDWLKEIAEGEFHILEPHNEHLLPIIKLLYVFQIQFLKLGASEIHTILLVTHAVTAFMFSYLVYLIFKRKIYSCVAGFIFLVHPFQWESVLWLFTIQIILCVLFFLTSLVFTKLYFEKQKFRFYLISIAFSFLQAYCFGFGLIFPLMNILFFYLFKNKKYSFKYDALYGFVFIINLVVYYRLAIGQFGSHTGGWSGFEDIKSIGIFFFGGTVSNLGRSISFIDSPGRGVKALYLLLLSLLIIAILLLIIIQTIKGKKIVFKTLIFSGAFYLLIFAFLAVSRFNFGISGSFSSRYTYFYLMSIILGFIAVWEYLRKIKERRKLINGMFLALCITFLSLSLLKKREYVNRVEERNVHNKLELMKYIGDETYDPDFSELHPYLSKEDIKNTAKKLDLLNLGE